MVSMGTKKYVEAVIAVILLIVLVFIAQLVVGVFGTASAQVNNTLVTTAGKNSLAVNQFGQVGNVNSTIIPFITVIIVVALVVILLDLFGVDLGAYFRAASGGE
jgi:hypothetical protein